VKRVTPVPKDPEVQRASQAEMARRECRVKMDPKANVENAVKKVSKVQREKKEVADPLDHVVLRVIPEEMVQKAKKEHQAKRDPGDTKE